jgi:hypothetical protein
MNTLEDRVRTALRAHAEDFSADPDAWARIQRRSLTARSRRARVRWSRPGRFLIPAAAAAAVVAIVVAAVSLSDAFGRATGAPADGANSPSATPSEPSSTGRILGFFLNEDPASSAILSMRLPRTSKPAVAYFWLARNSPAYWQDQVVPQIQLCHMTLNLPDGGGSGFCWPLPSLGVGQAAVVTGNEGSYVGDGQQIAVGAAAAQVRSVAAVLPDGRVFPGTVGTGRGFPYRVWAVGYPPAGGVRLVFRDASGTVVAIRSTAAPPGPSQIPQPRSGGITAFRYPASREGPAGAVMAYLIEGQVGFWSSTWGGHIAQVPAADGPSADGLIMSFGDMASRAHPKAPPKLSEAFGYARGDVARIVVHLPGGRQAATSTVTAWPGSGLRLWAVSVPTDIDYVARTFTVTAYDAAGHVIQTDTLGLPG